MRVVGWNARLLVALCAVAMMAVVAAGCGGDDEGEAAPAGADSGCKPQHEFKTVEEGKLTVAAISYMPAADVVGGKLTGIDGDIANEIAKRECLEVKAVKVNASGAIPYAQSGRADFVIGDWYRSKEREKIVDITVPIYLDALGVLSKDGFTSLSELEGKNVGDLQGNVWNREFKDILGDGYKLYQTIDQALADVENGRVDAAICTAAQVAYQQEQGRLQGLKLELLAPDERVPLTQEAPQSTFPHKKGNTAITEMLDAHITEMHESGFLEEIVNKYGVDPGILDVGPPRLV